jgi:hypothetical protein
MSPSPGDAPPAPDRKSSSSTILSAFRNLTSGRPKSASPASVLPAADTTVQSVFSKGEVKEEGKENRKLSENGSLSATTDGTAGSEDSAVNEASTVEPTVQPTVVTLVGGTPELAELLPQLHRARPLAERIAVVEKISTILDQHRVSNALAIWNSGEDLLVHDSDEASRAGHTLLVSCARSSDLSVLERTAFFRSMQSCKIDKHIDLLVKALDELTSKGKHVESLELLIAPYLVRLLRANFSAVAKSRRSQKKAKTDTSVREEESFVNLFQYIVDVTKFSGRAFHESDFNLVLEEVITICKKTTAESDIVHATNVINALLTYTRVSASSMRPCVELLGDIFRQLKELKKPTWSALVNIFRSHLGQTAVLHLINILQDAPTPSALPSNSIRGAVYTLSHLFRKNGKDGLPEVQLMLLLPALRTCLEGGDRKIAVDVLLLFSAMLESEVMFEKLKEEDEWDDFVHATISCVNILPLSSVEMSGDSQKSSKTLRDLDIPGASAGLEQMILILSTTLPDLDAIHKEAVVSLFLRLGSRLRDEAAEVLITYCAEDRLVYPSNSRWLENCRELVKTFVHDQNRSAHLRVLLANLLKDVYGTVELLSEQSGPDFALLALEKMSEEKDPTVMEALSSFAVMVVETASDDLFATIINMMRATIFQQGQPLATSQSLSPTVLPVGISLQQQPSLCRVAAKHVIRMFIANANKSAKKAEVLFDFILDVAGSNDCATDARICAIKLLFRLRATSDYAIYIRPLSESESMAAVLCRTAETANWIQTTDDPASRDARNVSSGSAQGSSTKQKQFHVKKPVPPLWFYPGPKGLPEEPPREPSSCLYSYVEPLSNSSSEPTSERATEPYPETKIEPSPETVTDPLPKSPLQAPTTLKMTHWLEKIIDLLQQPDTDWEIYSYVVVHMGAQLANQNLFKGAIPQVKFLRNVLCDQIRSASFHEPPSYTSLKKADVAICILHILTMLVSYHAHFAKSEEDEIVRAFILGIGSWDRTSKWSIHALSVCCHEMPLSVSKSLDSIIQKMSQIITQSQIAIHILEFLVMLARLPELYKNFREDEYKMVFGVSFRYLQYVRDQQEKEKDVTLPASSRPGRVPMRHSDSFRELRMLNDQDVRPSIRSPSDDLPQYVYALAFHVITFWFMNLRLQDRPLYMTWIAKNLTYTDKNGSELIEDQGLVTMDMMDKVAYSDRDETAADPQFAKEPDGEISQRTWIVGLSLLTIETAGRTGLSQITRRRPSGTKYFTYRPILTSPPRHQVPIITGLAADAFYTNSYIGVLPEDVLQEFYSSFTLVAPKAERPIPLPAEDAVKRAITSFDRNSTVDGHKIGVIYIGQGQVNEVEILANTHGPSDYTSFIRELGTLTRLKGAQFNTQGLDRAGDGDGKYTYCWRDRATEIVFHITSMMPTDLEYDAQCVKKKSHIGNDFVNIVWNDSGQPFQFDTFPSAFNYVYIIITPETTHSFSSIRDKVHPPSCFYKVHVLSAPGFPEISPAAETKIVSAKALPYFVRLLALNASVFSLVWANREGGEHFSPWRNRLREIKRLREKYAGIKPSASGTNSSPSPLSAAGSHGSNIPPTTEKAASNAAQSLISHPYSSSYSSGAGRERGASTLANRVSLATFGSDNMSRSSLTPSSVDTDHGEHGLDR